MIIKLKLEHIKDVYKDLEKIMTHNEFGNIMINPTIYSELKARHLGKPKPLSGERTMSIPLV